MGPLVSLGRHFMRHRARTCPAFAVSTEQSEKYLEATSTGPTSSGDCFEPKPFLFMQRDRTLIHVHSGESGSGCQ
jgi:hypothetical protein